MRLTNDKKKAIVHFESTIKFKDQITAKFRELQSVIEADFEKELPKTKPPKEWEKFIPKSKIFSQRGNSWINRLPNILGERSRQIELTREFYYSKDTYGVNFESKEIKRTIKEFDALLKEKNDFKNKLMGVLNAFTTVGKLLKEIPDLENHFKDTTKVKSLVPIKEIKEISESLVRPLEKENKK